MSENSAPLSWKILMGAIRSAPGKYFLEKTISRTKQDPEKNIMHLLDLGLRIATLESHKKTILYWKETLLQRPNLMELINRALKELDPHIIEGVLFNFLLNWIIYGQPKAVKKSQELGIHLPTVFLLDPTSRCNLRCTGCWAGEYAKSDTLDYERVDRLLNEAEDLGIYWIVVSGGEPFLYPNLIDMATKHKDMCFMVYTNGTLIDEKMADKLFEVANISPAFSLEGWEEETDQRRGKGVFQKIMHAMDLLHEKGVLYGFSVTITRQNCYEVMSEEFMDFLVKKGCFYGWTFHYVPVGRDPDFDLMVTPQQRAWLAQQAPYLRSTKPIQFADFWNDGELVGGCIAGGKSYFHINARGDVEPCAFVHFATDNIKEKSLVDVLKSPLFMAYQKRQPFSKNLLRPCPIIDVPWGLRDIVKESGAYPTHPGADDILKPENAHILDEKARAWKKEADRIWLQRHPEAASDPEFREAVAEMEMPEMVKEK